MVWGPLLLGFFCGALAPSLSDVPRLVAGEVTGLLCVMALGREASPALSHAKAWPSPSAPRLTSPPDERFMLDDYDADESSTRTGLCIARWLVRPRLLSRL
jgi:hypothetical protein